MPQPTAPALASVSVDRIATAFIAWAEQEPGRYWWWPRDIRLDPDEVIADDGEGNTYRVPFTTDGELDVTFGDAVEVRETFVDVAAPAAAAAAASARVQQRVLARGLPKPDKPDPTNPAASRPESNQEGSIVTPEERRKGLGLAADATDEQVRARLAELTPPDEPETPDEPEQPETSEPETPDEPEQPETSEPEAEVETPEPEPTPEPAAAASADTVSVSRQVWEQTTSRLDALEQRDRDREQAAATSRRDALASGWVREGRITPAERDHYRQMLDLDETKTTALAASLQAGRVPLAERGHNDDTAATGGATATGWFPQLQES